MSGLVDVHQEIIRCARSLPVSLITAHVVKGEKVHVTDETVHAMQ